MKKVLYKSSDIRKEIAQIFSSSKGRRVAITAFVGDGAEAYLRKPEGLQLICWPKAGGTNPNALRNLIKKGIGVYFADALHMKVYWTEDCGAVITSANLSTNALGAGDLREIGVRLSSKDIDIDRIISSIKPRSVSSSELRDLDRRHKLYSAKNHFNGRSKSSSTFFNEWYESYSLRADWKLGYWEDYADNSLVARNFTQQEYGATNFHWSIAAKRGQYQKGDWVLCFRVGKNSLKAISWMYVDFIIRVPRSDKKAYDPKYPYEVVQVWSLRHYEPPPFILNSRFRSVFSKAIFEYGLSRIKGLKVPNHPKRLADLVYKYYAS